jgi:mannose-6-phosphate isomerase
MTTPGPFTLAPLLLGKPWGGTSLEPLLRIPSSGRLIGEAWLLSDLASTSPSGAGGAAIESTVEMGWGEGRSIRDLISGHAVSILGREAERFPLLLKVLDARRHLSVQVHPSPRYVQQTVGAHVKTEAWFCLNAAPDSSFMVGLLDQPDREVVRWLAQTQQIGAKLIRTVVRPGDAVLIPSGTIHALGAGNLVFEVQTASDTTFRLYDWGRELGLPARELHLEAALEAADYAARPCWSLASSRNPTATLFDAPAFSLGTMSRGSYSLATPSLVGGAVLLFPLGQNATLSSDAGSYPLLSCRISVVPACLVSSASVNVPVGGSVLWVGVH